MVANYYHFRLQGKWKDGSPYYQQYAWFLRFGDEGKVVQVRAYLDTATLDRGLGRNE